MLRARLARPGRTLRLLDTAELTAGPGEEAIRASVTDMAAMTVACQGADAVIHLAGLSGEAPWPEILEVNINGTYVVFEAARRSGVPRVVFASSNHAAGFYPHEDFPVPDYAFPVPDTYYGVAKVAGEGLAAMYHYRYGLDAVCIRILTCFERPPSTRALATFVERELGPLFAHDQAHGTRLTKVLGAYLAEGGNKAAAAGRAHLARPTFYERLRLIERILGVGLDSAESRTSLHVALLAIVSGHSGAGRADVTDRREIGRRGQPGMVEAQFGGARGTHHGGLGGQRRGVAAEAGHRQQ